MTKEQKEAQKKSDRLIDEMLSKSGLSPEAVLGQSGLVAQLTRRVVERALAGGTDASFGLRKGE